ncbi:MAG: galactose mutarotase [Proteobacteria bacterium]|nr:galactose mutarotase [Pseudomonadota bacterium]MBS0574630.1 galactose mutarotase [Pseudomonadota bacterium]
MTIRRFGTAGDGQPVEAIGLAAGGIAATVLTLGAILQDVRLAGVDWPLTLGFADVGAYGGPGRWFGSIVGPVANRIGKAQADIGGRTFRFQTNEGASTCLHSGDTGTDRQIWRLADATTSGCTLTLDLPDGLGGFPGNRRLAAAFGLDARGCLSLDLSATTDAPTLMNLANHSYWNLDGAPTTEGQSLKVRADTYLPTDAAGLPEASAPVAGTRFDLRRARALGPGDRLDNNYCLDPSLGGATRGPALAAILTGRRGVEMRLFTDAPGLQVYDGAGIGTSPWAGHGGGAYGPRAGVALEPQFWPDAPGRPGFPPILLLPGMIWRQRSEWHFARPGLDHAARPALL